MQKLLPFESATIIPSDVVYRQAHMIQAVSKICSNNQLEEELNKHLNQFDNNIQSISFNTNNQLKLKVKNIKEKLPLSAFGDGLKKYLHIVSAFMADNAKTIYIDEVENGLHFSRMRLLLEKIIDFIKKNKDRNLQVFMTTHSQEFVEILDQVIKEKNFANQTKLFCLERDGENIIPRTYYGESLEYYFENEENLFG